METTRVHISVEDFLELELSDATLQTEDGHTFPIHRYKLAENSAYFLALFRYTGDDKNNLLIPGVEGGILRGVLDYVYTGTLHIAEENLCELIIAADYLALEKLQNYLETVAMKDLTVRNSIAIFAIALRINRVQLSKCAFRFIETNFENIVSNKTADFYEMHPELLKQVLNSRNLRVRSETIVWTTIVEWVEADLTDRLRHVPDLLKCLKVADVDEDLATEILGHNMVVKNKFCETMACENAVDSTSVIKFRHCMLNNAAEIPQLEFYRRPSRLHFMARLNRSSVTITGIEIFVTYDESLDLWRKVTQFNSILTKYLVAVGNYIYIADYNRIFQYHIIEKQWRELPSFIITRRSGFCVVELQGLIYVLGGGFLGGNIYNVEVYDPEEDAWRETTPVIPPIKNFQAIALDGSIYIVGWSGNLLGQGLIFQSYNPGTKIWSMLPEPSLTRISFDLIGYQGQLYLFQGKMGNSELKDVEIYDPKNNIWHSTTNLPYDYESPTAIVVDDRLIVFDTELLSCYLDYHHIYAKYPPVQWEPNQKRWNDVDESCEICNLRKHFFTTLEEIESINFISNENKDPATAFEKKSIRFHVNPDLL